MGGAGVMSVEPPGGISALVRRKLAGSGLRHVRGKRHAGHLQTRTRALATHWVRQHLALGHPASVAERNVSLVSTTQSGVLVIAPQMDKDRC